MANQPRRDDLDPIILRFDHGINTRALADKIGDAECAYGSQNFSLDLDTGKFGPRASIDLVGMAPNGEQIAGWGQLETSSGSLSTLIQAGTTVYSWDGTSSGFTSVGSVPANSRLRGPLGANFLLDDVAIITDLAKAAPVKTWDGTTLSDMTTGLGNEFRAKYCVVDNERAIFANVFAGSDTPHLIVGSERGNKDSLSVSDRPSSTASAADPFYIPIQDLRPINGLAKGFGVLGISTVNGQTWKLSGSDATDFQILPLHAESAVAGDEALVNIGNDIIIPRVGRIDTMSGVQAFGDVQTDDLSREIQDLIENVDSWQVAYDPRLSRVYCLPQNGPTLYVFHKSLWDNIVGQVAQRQVGRRVSAWSPWTTALDFGFSSTTMWTMKRPGDKLFYSYIGDSSGNLYQFEGTGLQDGGSADVTSTRVSKMISLPRGEFYDLCGEVRYRKVAAGTLTLTIQWSGNGFRDDDTTITLKAPDGASYYGGSYYYGGTTYYGIPFQFRRVRHPFGSTGQDAIFQIKAEVTGADFNIEEIVLYASASVPDA